MTYIVDSMRKHQKIIVLGVAFAVITLYMVPVDQLVQGLSPRAQGLQDRFDAIIARLSAFNVDTSGIEQTQYRIVNLVDSLGL